MYVFAEPVTEERADEIQHKNAAAVAKFKRSFIDVDSNDPEVQAEWQEIQGQVEQDVTLDADGERIEEPPTTKPPGTEKVDPSEDSEVASDKNQPPGTEKAGSSEESEVANDQSQPPGGPIMGWTLTLRHRVNGEIVSSPSNLTSNDRWTIEYTYHELEGANATRLYELCKRRRAKALTVVDKDLENERNVFRQLLKKYTEKGRKWRVEQDKLDEAMGEAVVFRPLSEA